MDVLAGGQIHDCIGAPADRPDHFLDFFLDRGTERRIAQVAVDLHSEIAADDHRLQFGMIDVGGNDRPAARDLGAYEFRGDGVRDGGAKIFAPVLAQQTRVTRVLAQFLQPQRLAQGNVLHFWSDDTTPGVVHLGHAGSSLGAVRRPYMLESQVSRFGIGCPNLTVAGRRTGESLGIVTLLDPRCPQGRQTLAQVDARVRVGVRTGRVIDRNRWIVFGGARGRRWVLGDFADRDTQVRARTLEMNLAGVRIRAGEIRAQLGGGAKQLWRNDAHAIVLGSGDRPGRNRGVISNAEAFLRRY